MMGGVGWRSVGRGGQASKKRQNWHDALSICEQQLNNRQFEDLNGSQLTLQSSHPKNTPFPLFPTTKTHPILDFLRPLPSPNVINMQSGQCERVYHYLIIGAQGIGKTNLITRFIKDEFIEAHNLTLEGQQTAIYVLNSCKFKIVFEDNRNISNVRLITMEEYKRIDALIFAFSLDQQATFEAIEEQLRYFLGEVRAQLLAVGRRLPCILVGNKADLLTPTLSLINNFVGEREEEGGEGVGKKSISERVRPFEEMGVRYFQISTKCSSKREIEAVFLELINQNEINRFVVEEQTGRKEGWWQFVGGLPCASEESGCAVY